MYKRVQYYGNWLENSVSLCSVGNDEKYLSQVRRNFWKRPQIFEMCNADPETERPKQNWWEILLLRWTRRRGQRPCGKLIVIMTDIHAVCYNEY